MRPPLATRVLGHPLVALGITIACGYVIYLWAMDDTLWFAAMIAFLVMYQTWGAVPKAARHMSWMRAWNGMGGGGPGRATLAARQAVGTLLIIGVGYYLFTQSSNAEYAFALGWMVFVPFAATGFLLWRWLKRRRTAQAYAKPVAVCIAKPTMTIPTLEQAYEALPAHCWQVLD